MKKTLPFLILQLLVIGGFSQWPNGFANPIEVSNTTCLQFSVKQVPDGNDGTYVFWIDSRTGCNNGVSNDVYGQHYDGDGIAQWEIGGREIVNRAGSINLLEVATDEANGEIIIGYLSAYDSLLFRRVDNQGSPVWSQDILAGRADGCTGYYILGYSNLSIVRDNVGYTALMNATYCGGSNGNRIVRFSGSGIMEGGVNGSPEGDQYYNGSPGLHRTYDGSNDVYLVYSNGNGSGAHGSCLRVGADGDSLWGPVDVLAGTNGLSYQLGALSDDSGIVFAFQSSAGDGTGNNIYMRKRNSDGTEAWNGDIITVCGATGDQGSFFITQDDDYYYIVWADGRPGIIGYYAVYAQKVNKSTGAMSWGTDGILILDQNSYSPSPECVMSSDGNLIICNTSTNFDIGFNSIVVDTDNGSVISMIPYLQGETYYSPFYSDYVVMTSGTNVIVAWAKTNPSGGADGIYIARLLNDAQVTLSETTTACDSYTSNGETLTESGIYIQQLSSDTLLTLYLTVSTSSTSWMDVQHCGSSYSLNGEEYTSSGTFTQTLTNAAGCDSILTLNLYLNNLQAEIITNNGMLTSTTTAGSPTWIDCDDNSIVFENVWSYQPLQTGEYALIVNFNGCTDTSDCVLFTITGAEHLNHSHEISIFPNPGMNEITIQSPSSINNGGITIYDSMGKIVFAQKNLFGNRLLINSAELSSGYYIIEIETDQRLTRHSWIRE